MSETKCKLVYQEALQKCDADLEEINSQRRRAEPPNSNCWTQKEWDDHHKKYYLLQDANRAQKAAIKKAEIERIIQKELLEEKRKERVLELLEKLVMKC